jgi:CubicO group peptidase (beta-lactamase class C family)
MTTTFDVKLLEPLLKRAEETHSDALVVMHRGELVGVWRFGKPKQLVETMSVTKSIVNLAIGKLVTKGLLTSIDEPVCSFYPEWKQGRKKNITIRHIMNHVSGLQSERTTKGEIYPSPDFVQLALCAELTHEPGAEFFYNNKAVNLLAGIVERICGQKLDAFMTAEIFAPLGIAEFYWQKDNAGNPHAMAGLGLFPEDLAKVGQLMLNRGIWSGQQVIDASWFDLIESQNLGSIGLLWWVERNATYRLEGEHIANLHAAGASEDVLEKLEKIKGIYTSERALGDALKGVFGDAWTEVRERLPKGVKRFDVTYQNVTLYYAQGDLGQYLDIFPQQQLIFVRMISEQNFQTEDDFYNNFSKLATDIAKSL